MRNSTYIKDVRIENIGLRDISVNIDTSEPLKCGKLVTDILDADSNVVASAEGATSMLTVPDGKLWSPESPYLYTLRSRIINGDTVLDEKRYRFGLRTAKFENNGFYLNGKKMKLRGLNRHQSFAYSQSFQQDRNLTQSL